MTKVPKNLPVLGDRCKLRGRGGEGRVTAISERGWVDVEWTATGLPKICHLHELEQIE